MSDLNTEVAILKREVADMKLIFNRLDTAIENRDNEEIAELKAENEKLKEHAVEDNKSRRSSDSC